MEFYLRDIDVTNEAEINLIVERAMETVLETIPEFERSREIALNTFSNFTFDQMKEMFKRDYDNPDHRTIVAVDKNANSVVGHAIFSLKVDSENQNFGFCYSRFVHPNARKNGIASAFLKEQEKWWRERNASYILAQTHETNIKLQKLFLKHGFEKKGPIKGKVYSYYELRKKLTL